MINFTVGPVQSEDCIRQIGSEQVPYFRTIEFSQIMLENEKLIKKFVNAEERSKVVFITGSGTASMEASVMNTLSKKDKALVINGGSFGQRFVDLLELYEIPFTEIKLKAGSILKKEQLSIFDNQGYTAFLVNVHETSTGVLYDINMISDFCKKNRMFLIADCISSFLADPFDMKKLEVDIMITGSQKALACSPGISILILSKHAIERVYSHKIRGMYLNLKLALNNMDRGQTPFTPAVSILRQIHQRLLNIDKNGGINSEINKTAKLAKYFREGIKNLPFNMVPENMSNAVTALHPLTTSAYGIFEILKNEYNIWVCPNGGEMKDFIFRVGHIGNLTIKDYDKLILALRDLQKRNII